MEFAGNPGKMSKILGSFNNANLGKVANTGVIENARDEANTILNNFKAEDAVAEMAYKEEAADATRDYRSEVAGIQQDANSFNDITSGVGAVAGAGIKASGFSLFGGGDKGLGSSISGSVGGDGGDAAGYINNYGDSRLVDWLN